VPGSQQQQLAQLFQQQSGLAAAPAVSRLALPPVHERPGPTAQQLAAEQAAAAAVVAATPPFTLQVRGSPVECCYAVLCGVGVTAFMWLHVVAAARSCSAVPVTMPAASA
jgi:hypothetical protein